MPSLLIEKCCNLLIEQKRTIAFAESATGGRICSEFALVPESGKSLLGCLVTYDGNLKQDLLDVPQDLIDRFTPESAQVTEAMAWGLKKVIDADVIVANTGLTSSGGSETPEKPVGTMFIHILYGDKPIAFKKKYSGLPEKIVLQTAEDLAILLIEILENRNIPHI